MSRMSFMDALDSGDENGNSSRASTSDYLLLQRLPMEIALSYVHT